MSDATYRIEVKYDAGTSTRFRYDWNITRLSDDVRTASGWAEDEAKAIEEAQAAISRIEAQPYRAPVALYADDHGRLCDAPVPVPQSLRA